MLGNRLPGNPSLPASTNLLSVEWLTELCLGRRQAGGQPGMAVRLKEMWFDVLSVLRIPTFQILILQGIV